MYSSSRWLYYVGLLSFFSAILVLVMKSFQLYYVLGSTQMTKGNGVAQETLDEEMTQMLAEYKE